MPLAAALARAMLRAPRALFAASAHARARARGLATAAPPPLVFYVKRACDADFAEVEVAAGASVAALKRAVLAELRLDASPDAVTLALEKGGPRLDATLTLAEALAVGALAPRAKLLATMHAPAGAAEAARNDAVFLPYHVADPDIECEPQEIKCDADFYNFVRSHSLWAVTDKPGGGQKRSMITNLASALRALNAGARLLLR